MKRLRSSWQRSRIRSQGAWIRENNDRGLDAIRHPEDLRRLEKAASKKIADELREETIRTVSVTGGHLGSGLGVVELTVALHHVFDTPDDRLIWDVGHQVYPHKIITGRRAAASPTLRAPGGLSGFTKPQGERLRPFRAPPSRDLHFRRAGHGQGARPDGRVESAWR